MRTYLQSIALVWLAGRAASQRDAPSVEIDLRRPLDSRLANVHLTWSGDFPAHEHVKFTFGSCSAASEAEAHHGIETGITRDHSRLLWVLPEDVPTTGACVSAWNSRGQLVGRSDAQNPRLSGVHELRRRRLREKRQIAMDNSTGIDVYGAWFDGVDLLKDKEPGPIDVRKAKQSKVAIVGAGASGLMTFLILHQAGMKNIEILEGGDRLGGRIRTRYLSGGPFDYSYQEMGPMRFPSTIVNPETEEEINITDHQMVFQLGEELNRLNKRRKGLQVDFAPWIQSNPNGLFYHDGFKLDTGLPPTRGQIADDPSLGDPTTLSQSSEDLQAKMTGALPQSDFIMEMATNMFKAHKKWIDSGLAGEPGDHWSEFAFVSNYLQGSLNDTFAVGARYSRSFLDKIQDDMLYFEAATWKTIDGGLNRLAEAFHPLVDDITHMNRFVEKVDYLDHKKQVKLSWKGKHGKGKNSATYDYAIMSVPLSIARTMKLPDLDFGITQAIASAYYAPASKVALEFSERFWEHYDIPIVGGCGTTSDILGIGSICYPSYNMNGTGPASILASYTSNIRDNVQFLHMSEQEYVDYVLDAMVEIHGDFIRPLYTGKYNVQRWYLDPLALGGWFRPDNGMHELFLPEYFKTHKKMIFVGEHTSYTHAWIASAIESGIRGGVQLLLELGLVDEAKEAVEKWMARWIDI